MTQKLRKELDTLVTEAQKGDRHKRKLKSKNIMRSS